MAASHTLETLKAVDGKSHTLHFRSHKHTHTLFFCLLFVFDVAAIICCHQPIFTPGTTAVNTELMYLEGRGAGGINSA